MSMSAVGRQFGQKAARAAAAAGVGGASTTTKTPLSRISEHSSSGSVDGGGVVSGCSPRVPGFPSGGAAVTVSPAPPGFPSGFAWFNRILHDPYAVAGMVFVISTIVLCATRPPMALHTSPTRDGSYTLSPRKVILWSGTAAGVALALPWLFKHN